MFLMLSQVKLKFLNTLCLSIIATDSLLMFIEHLFTYFLKPVIGKLSSGMLQPALELSVKHTKRKIKIEMGALSCSVFIVKYRYDIKR